MRKNTTLALLCLLLGSCTLFILSGCMKDKATKTYTILRPVYKAKSSVLSEINGNATQSFENTGKIYIKDKFIFLNDLDKGIHIIDNSDPAHPLQTAFLNIPGNQDIAVKGNTLYADMYDDLLAIDISDPTHVYISHLLPDFFISRQYINGFYADSNQVIVDWIKKDTTVSVDAPVPPYPACNACMFEAANATDKSAQTGVAGSMAKMVLINNYLYAITEPHGLGVVNAGNASLPYLAASIFAGFDLQTIYPFRDKLFLGSAVGMFMYDISDPVNPVALGQFSHGRACDPVVADDNYAYVTLHAGTECGGSGNELDVINVQDILQPELIRSYPMTKPTGLCKDGNLLFVCDGSDGVKLYDAVNPVDLILLQQIESNEPYDIIAGNNNALVIAKDGLYQYDYSDIHHIRLLSFFPTKR